MSQKHLETDKELHIPQTPRWVKILGVITVIMFLLLVVMASIHGFAGSHGFSMHMPAHEATMTVDGQ